MLRFKALGMAFIAASHIPLIVSAAYAQSNPAQSFENALNRSLKQMDDAREEQREQERLRIEQERLRIEQEKLKLEREAAERARTTSNPSIASTGTSPLPDLGAAKSTCADLGFVTGSEKFGECVLKLMPISSTSLPTATPNNRTPFIADKEKLLSLLDRNGWKFVKNDEDTIGALFQFTVKNASPRSVTVYSINNNVYGIAISVYWTDNKLKKNNFLNVIKDKNKITPNICPFAFTNTEHMIMRSDFFGRNFEEDEFIHIFNGVANQQQFCVQKYLSL